MTTPTPIRTGPTPCGDSAVECLLEALAVVAVLPVALWILSDPVLAVAVGTSIAAGVLALSD